MNVQRGAARRAVLIVARRLDGARSGSNSYLKDYLRLCRAAGLSTRIVFAPRRSFGNLAWARLDPEIAGLVDQIDWPQSLQLGGVRLSLSPTVWLAMGRRLLAEALRRLTGQAGAYPSLLGAELSAREAAEVLAHVGQVEVVTAEYSSLAPLLEEVEAPRRIVFLHDLFSLRAETFAAQGLTPDHVVLSRKAEAARCRAADLLIHASCIERDAFRPLLPEARHEWMPPVARPVQVQTDPTRPSHGLFVGSVHKGNVEALTFLRQKIWPQVCAQLPEAELWIAGSIAETVSERDARAEGLMLLGPVEDLATLGGVQTVALAPMKSGSGIPIKVVDYLSLGMAVAVTAGTLDAFGGALEGLVVEAASDADYAAMICQLLQDDSRRRALSAAAAQAESRLHNPALLDCLKS